MQLTTSSKHRAGPVRIALAAASASLLTGMHVHAEENPWLVDSGLLVYSESGGRVQATEPIVSLKKDMGDEHYLSMKFTFDSLTGATPNGAIPSKKVVTITGSSGQGSTTTTIGELPLDKGFHDTREAFNLGWDQPLGETNRFTIGGNYSRENDFLSQGFNAAFAQDFNEKNTTISFGINTESDTINPIGGIRSALQSMSNTTVRTVSDTKKVNDILVGVSQIISHNWLTQLNYSRSTSSGYQNDPYKILSVVDTDGNSIVDTINSASNLLIYENRPNSRLRQSVFWSNKIHFAEDVIDISLRHYSDDWGIKSNTIDVRYRMEVGESSYLEPHYRYYTQTAANFYKPFLINGTDIINGVAQIGYASADQRLADFNANTLGLKWGVVLGRNSEFNIRVEQYKQNGNPTPAAAKNMSALSGLNLFPGLSATIILVGYSFEF